MWHLIKDCPRLSKIYRWIICLSEQRMHMQLGCRKRCYPVKLLQIPWNLFLANHRLLWWLHVWSLATKDIPCLLWKEYISTKFCTNCCLVFFVCFFTIALSTTNSTKRHDCVSFYTQHAQWSMVYHDPFLVTHLS